MKEGNLSIRDKILVLSKGLLLRGFTGVAIVKHLVIRWFGFRYFGYLVKRKVTFTEKELFCPDKKFRHY